jgi:hypothetical protein
MIASNGVPVNLGEIDKVSSIAFPTMFALFNVSGFWKKNKFELNTCVFQIIYWSYYVSRSKAASEAIETM